MASEGQPYRRSPVMGIGWIQMLSEEQRQAIAAKLAETHEAPVEQESASPEDTVDKEQPVEAAAPEPNTENEEAPKPDQKPQEPTPPVAQHPPRMVPIEEVAKLRRDKRELKSTLDAIQREVAELRGYVQATKSAPRSKTWLEELEDTPTDETVQEDPRDVKLREMEAVVQSIQSERGQALLDRVIATAKAQDPTITEDFLIKHIGMGWTPEQALNEWAGYKGVLIPQQENRSPANTPPPPPENKPTPKAPPTVTRAPSGKDTSHPKTWSDVSQAVRRAMAR